MKYNVILLCVIVALFLITNVSADNQIPDPTKPDFVFKQNTQNNFTVPCIVNGTYCSSTAICNATITNTADGAIIVNNARLTNQNTVHNLSLTRSQVVRLGYYKADVSCKDGSVAGSQTLWIQVNPSGDRTPLGLYIIIIVLGYALLFWSVTIKNEEMAIMAGLYLIPLGLYTLNNGIDIYRNSMTETFSFFTIGIGAIWAIIAALSLTDK